MNFTDLMPNLKKKNVDLESEITEDYYEKDYNAKNPTTPITIKGADYELKTEQYENLMQILEKTGTRIEEIKELADRLKFDKYFGIKIEKEAITGLQITNYELTAMPEEITQLTNLKILYLYSNQLSTLPDNFAQLTNLQKLNLEDNQLKTLPEEIKKLKQKGVYVYT
jgi:Leucine-rich repeat (LRR) protein